MLVLQRAFVPISHWSLDRAWTPLVWLTLVRALVLVGATWISCLNMGALLHPGLSRDDVLQTTLEAGSHLRLFLGFRPSLRL